MKQLPSQSRQTELWKSVERLVRSQSEILAFHQRLSEMRSYAVNERDARQLMVPVLTSMAVLETVRRESNVPLVLLKGLQIGGLYPQAWMRDTGDLDILTTDPDQLFQDLQKAGFIASHAVSDVRHHQLPPLRDPIFGLSVEIHRRPNTGGFGNIITVEDCFADAVPSRVNMKGILAPSPNHEFVLHLAHSWADRPLGRVRDLIDLELLAQNVGGPAAALSLARQFKLKRVWSATVSAQDWVLRDTSPSMSARVMGRHLDREFKPSKDVFRRLLSPFCADSVSEAVRMASREMRRAFAGNPGETLFGKIKRTVS
jgi:Uncharacterised nucleotidyltransferase